MTLRRTGIQRGTSQLKRSGPIKAKRISIVPGQSSVNPIKPKRPKVTAEERAGKDGVKARAEVELDGVTVRLCECCGDRPGSEWSHRIGRAQCGTWAISNGLLACEFCHRWMHANPNDAKAVGWHVHPADDPEKRQVLRRGEWVWLRSDGSTPPAPAPSLPFEEAS